MKFKQGALLIISTFFILASSQSQAGRQGVSFYYGLGAGVVAPTDLDAAPAGDIMFGMEEDGWALEGLIFRGLEAGTSDSAVNYTGGGSHAGLAYRTIERGGNWFKYKVSATKFDFDLSNQTTTTSTRGLTYTIGWGMRMAREARLEIDYNYYNSDDLNDPIHMVFARYFWGGSEYQGKAF